MLEKFKLYRKSEHYIRNNVVVALGAVSAFIYSLTSHTLSLWLTDLGIPLKVLGFVSLIHVIHAFKILWIPIFEKFDIPLLKKYFDRRASWIFLFILTAGLLIFWVSFMNPFNNPWTFAACVGIATFSMSVLDTLLRAQIIILSTDKKDQATIVGLGAFGFRIGMYLAVQIFLLMSDAIDWKYIYRGSGFLIAASSLLIFLLPRLDKCSKVKSFKELLVLPYKDFFFRHRNYVWSIIGFMVFFKLQDRLLAPLNYKFFTQLKPTSSFSLLNQLGMKQVFSFSKIISGFLMGFGIYASIKYIKKYSYKTIAIAGVILHSLTCLPLLILNSHISAQVKSSIVLIFSVIFIEKIIRVFSGNVYYLYQSRFCSKEYAAGQIAMIGVLESGFGAVLGSSSGYIVANCSWTALILLATVISLPVLFFITRLPKDL